MHKTEVALRAVGLHFIGGFRTRKSRPSRSKYTPHNGEQEKARRLRQMKKVAA